MLIDELIVTHSAIRDIESVGKMIEFVKNGGFFTNDVLSRWAKENNTRVSPLIQISIFPDGEKYIHDGHHRTLAILLGGRNSLREDEYSSLLFEYEKYKEISFSAFSKQFFTPFDVKTEVRLPDFKAFKEECVNLFTNGADLDKMREWILSNKHRFCVNRKVKHIKDLWNVFI